MSTTYTADFFKHLSRSAEDSASVMLPLVLNQFKCERVVDVGCGEGAWLKACIDLGIKKALGMDGDYVPRSQLKIPQENFRAVDLTKPPSIEESFDLAISMEVAEHLPSASA